MTLQTQSPANGHDEHVQTIVVSVNRRDVVFHERHATGAQIKATAIAQHVPVQQDFNLYEVRGEGQLDPISDTDRVTLHPNQRFRATAPDDNS